MDMYFGASPSIFENARNLRNHMTIAEKILWSKLNRNQIPGHKFRRQHPISDFIADFYCHSAKLIIEVDGKVHDNFEQKLYDLGREFELNKFGIKIIRFKNEEVLGDVDSVINKIKLNIAPIHP